MVEYHHISAEDLSRLHQFGKKVLPSKLFGYVLHAKRICKGDILVADTEELEKMDASEIHATRLNAKTPMSGEKMVFPVANGTDKIYGDRVLRRSTFIRDRPNRVISGPFQGTYFTVNTLNPESNCTVRPKNISEFIPPARKIEFESCK